MESPQRRHEIRRRISNDSLQGRHELQRQFSLDSLHSRHENQRRISVDSSEGGHENHGRISVSSVVSDRKYSPNDGTRPRRMIMTHGFSPKRKSGASFIASFTKAPEPNDNSSASKKSFENTYRLEPKAHFPERRVRSVIEEALGTLLSHRYSASHSPFLAKLLSARVLENVKQLSIERYKVVCLVTIGSKVQQGLRIASRCLWDEHFDTFVTVSLEGEHFFAVGTVFGVYYE